LKALCSGISLTHHLWRFGAGLLLGLELLQRGDLRVVRIDWAWVIAASVIGLVGCRNAAHACKQPPNPLAF